jgi:filamentous hemagglutinin family protein
MRRLPLLQANMVRRPCLSFPRLSRRPLSVLVPLIVGFGAASAHAVPPLPQGGRFVAGSGSIGGAGNQVTITQTSTHGVIDWTSFSIGNGGLVNVNNGSGATLSRVTGPDVSRIDGALKSTGSFYLVNPQGVVIGTNGVVTTVGRFVASALDVSNDAFMAGSDLTFTGNGSGSVINLGKISSTGGDVLLISHALAENDGAISAPTGSAELAAANTVLVHDSSTAPQTYVQATSHGDAVNKGDIAAAQIALQAADGNVFALAAHNTALRATGTATRDGHVWLVAPKGTAHVHTPISATNADGSGGTVDTTGAALHLDDADIHAAQWNLDAPVFNVGPSTTATLLKQLDQGTSVALNATQGDVVVEQTVRWNGDASLTVNAHDSVTVGPIATLGNVGKGNLILRADANGIDNGASVTNRGTIDWTKSTGIVSALYDMTGKWTPGTLRTNGAWSAAAFSGLKTQATAYQLVNSLGDLQKISQNLAGNYALGKDLSGAAGTTLSPIGADGQKAFTGQLDGFGHTLDDLSWSNSGSTTSTGLFVAIGATGVVRDLSITNASLVGGYGMSGIVAGSSAGLIANVVANGTVQVSDSRVTVEQDGDVIGGIVGSNSGTISRSRFSGEIEAPIVFGGIAASNSGTIVQSDAEGYFTFNGGAYSSGGGLVQNNSGLIRESYVDTFVNAITAAGLATVNSGTIEESFSAAEVTPYYEQGRASSGSVAGTNAGHIANDVYWAVDAPGGTVNSAVGAGASPSAANGFVVAQMSNPASFAATWNFAPGGTWYVAPGYSHPILRWELSR